MALGLIEAVRLRIGDTEASTFYPLLSDEAIEYFLLDNNNNVYAASQDAATAAYAYLTKIPTRERVGDVEVWNEVSKRYGEFLQFLIKQSPSTLYKNIANPYAAGISWLDVTTNYSNPDVVKSKLSLLEMDCYEKEGF